MNSMSLAWRSSMFLFVSIFSSVLAFANNAAPQPKLSDSEIAGIDRLFARWNRTNSPGFTVIIERITGMSLNDFAQKSIFEPLGMKNTFFESNYAAILPGRVESYRPKADGTYERILKHFNLYGDGGVITNIEDLARWDEVFYKDQIGGKEFRDLLLTQGRLNSGEILRYAFGLEIYEYKGHKLIEHGGGMLGFTVDMARFPKDHLTVIALANTPERWSTSMALGVADLLLRPPHHRNMGLPHQGESASLQKS